MIIDDDDGGPAFETGPFCRHYSDPAECEVKCTTCGHRCPEHDLQHPCECMVDGCNCTAWKE